MLILTNSFILIMRNNNLDQTNEETSWTWQVVDDIIAFHLSNASVFIKQS